MLRKFLSWNQLILFLKFLQENCGNSGSHSVGFLVWESFKFIETKRTFGDHPEPNLAFTLSSSEYFYPEFELSGDPRGVAEFKKKLFQANFPRRISKYNALRIFEIERVQKYCWSRKSKSEV